MNVLEAWHRWRWPLRDLPTVEEKRFNRMPLVLLPGWASTIARLEQPRIWRSVLSAAREQGWTPRTVVATTPHYLPLLECVPATVQTIYYASDDYRRYTGWRPDEMDRLERAMVERVDRAIFVSQALADRTRREQPHSAHKIHVSMNATEERFFRSASAKANGEIPGLSLTGGMLRPIVGVVGAINRRLDFDLLRSIAELDSVGTLLFVGPIQNADDPHVTALRANPKCRFIGEQPHETIPAWMQSLDVAIIPYREDPFNYYCSPMRLFDHLATGRPIVATDACDQVRSFAGAVRVVGRDEFGRSLEEVLGTLSADLGQRERIELAREHTWCKRAAALESLLEPR